MTAGETDWVPLVGCVPLQPPDAVQLVAFVLLHESVDDCPALIDVGFAEMVAVGMGVVLLR